MFRSLLVSAPRTNVRAGRGPGADDGWLPHVGRLTALRNLNLRRTNMTDEGIIEALVGFDHVLSCKRITDGHLFSKCALLLGGEQRCVVNTMEINLEGGEGTDKSQIHARGWLPFLLLSNLIVRRTYEN
jgi:hypothetical protein